MQSRRGAAGKGDSKGLGQNTGHVFGSEQSSAASAALLADMERELEDALQRNMDMEAEMVRAVDVVAVAAL